MSPYGSDEAEWRWKGYQSRLTGSGDGKGRQAYHPLTTRLPNPKSRLALREDAQEVDEAPGTLEQIVYSQGLEIVFARGLGLGDERWRSSNPVMEALGSGQVKVIQDSSISALGWKVQTVALLDSEKASPIYPQAQPAAP